MSAASIFRRPAYRTRQVLGALRPKVTRDELTEVERFLGAELFALFQAMDRADQRHCIDVYRAARRKGYSQGDVLTAALIHDCGKVPSEMDGKIRLWHRISYVALEALAPSLLRRLARRPGGLRLLARHAERGRELAEEHGAAPDVLDLLRRMEDARDGDERVRLLRAADDAA